MQDYKNLPYILEEVYILECGTFYFYETFVVSEIKEGFEFNGDMAKIVVDLITSHYDSSEPIGYISNRVNRYKVSTNAWIYFYNCKSKISSFAVVSNKPDKLFDKLARKYFNREELNKFSNLIDAASFVTNNVYLQKTEPNQSLSKRLKNSLNAAKRTILL